MSLARVAVAAVVASFAFVASAPVLSPAHADPLGVVAGESLDITADKLDVDVNGGTALLEGNVRAVLGELTVTCPKVEMKYDEAPRVKWARGSGGVRASMKGIVAKASVVVVNVASRRVQLQGGVRLTRGKGWVEADKASIDLKTRKVTLHGVKGSIPVEPPQR